MRRSDRAGTQQQRKPAIVVMLSNDRKRSNDAALGDNRTGLVATISRVLTLHSDNETLVGEP
jgi:hypothetical protein